MLLKYSVAIILNRHRFIYFLNFIIYWHIQIKPNTPLSQCLQVNLQYKLQGEGGILLSTIHAHH